MHCVKSATILCASLLLASCASTDQTEDFVYRREAGGALERWLPASEAAPMHLAYAWAALAAYQDPYDEKRGLPPLTKQCPDPNQFLRDRHWTRWDELPTLAFRPGESEPVSSLMRKHHLRAEVWSNPQVKVVIVAFGGTVPSSWQDWKSNLRWFVQPLFDLDDEYTTLTTAFVPAFVNAYVARNAVPGNEWMRTARVVATGHSLGGGLAQRFAYSLRAGQGVPPVKEVYGFDPSPVSGKRSTPDYAEQADGLTIYRIYNRGEILADLRFVLQQANPKYQHEQGQTWIDIRYMDDWSWTTILLPGAVQAHRMFNLACFMQRKLGASAVPGGTHTADTR